MNALKQEAFDQLSARRAAIDSLLAFTEYTHPSWETGAHHTVIAEALESVERGDIKRLIITAPPRHTKSELASRRFPAWYLGRNPNKQIICASYSDDFAQDLGRDVRGIVASPEYRYVFSTELAYDSRAAGRWQTNEGGRYVATGVGGPITGRGADIALLDDYLKNRQEADSEAIRESVWKWYKSTFYTRLQPGGAVIIIATRWHEDDLIGRVLEQKHENWHLIELKAINDKGEALWPEWYPLEALAGIKQTLGLRDWEAMYQQNPTVETGTFFRREWFKRYTDRPQILNKYITHDLAVTEGDGDYSEIGVWGIDPDDNLWAIDWWSGQKTLDVTIDALLDLVHEHKPLTVFGETGIIRRAVEPFLAKRMSERQIYTVNEWLTRTGDKLAMARSFQARCSMGKVYFPSTDWADRVINQNVGFPAAKYDDATDTCALIGLALDQTRKAVIPRAIFRGRNRKRPSSWITR